MVSPSFQFTCDSKKALTGLVEGQGDFTHTAFFVFCKDALVLLSIARQQQNSVCILLQLAGFLQICGAGGCVRRIAVQLCQRNHKDAGGLCQLMQGNGNSRDSLIAVFCLTVCQQLQIVDKNDLCFHPLGLCLYPSNALAGCRADEQRQLVQFCQAVKVRLRNALVFYICQRHGQTVRNDAGGQGVRVGFKAEIAHPEAPPGLLTGHLQGQGGFTGGRSAADDEQVPRGKMQVLVQHRDAAGDVPRLFIQPANVAVYQFPDRLEIIFFPVKGQGFAHFAVQVRQVCKGGQVASCLNGQFLKSCQSGLFLNKLRPFHHTAAGYGDILALALLHTCQNSGFLLRVAGTGCHRIQFAFCVPKTGQRRKHRLKVCREVFDLQIRQRVGGEVRLNEDRAQ
nr:MAG TPA: hypothetical protein [Caudoviricetes sp.]